MLIGLLSDTHINWPNTQFPSEVIKKAFEGVDLIIHAGDIWIPWVLDDLETIAPVLAAQGDDDMEEDIGGDKRIAQKQILSFEGVDLWVQHVKPRYGLINPLASSSYSNMFNRNPLPQEPVDPPDVVVFGHSHYAEIENYKGTILVNPGSPTLPQYVPKLGTIGLLTLESGQAQVRIVPLE